MTYTALKLIALASMLLDHLMASFANPVQLFLWDAFFPDSAAAPAILLALQTALKYLGRIAAPIFLWSVAQGFRHTRSRPKYALRLLLCALLSQYPYLLANRVWTGGLLTDWEIGGNILFTLSAGLLTLSLYERCRALHPAGGFAAAAAAVVLGELLPIEGGGPYLLFILLFHLTESWSIPRRALMWLLILPLSRYRMTALLLTDPGWFRPWCLNALGPFLGIALTFTYNGKPGRPLPKYLWYAVYPLHLLLLALIT